MRANERARGSLKRAKGYIMKQMDLFYTDAAGRESEGFKMTFREKVPRATGRRYECPAEVVRGLTEMGEYSQECFVVMTLSVKRKMISKNIVTVGLLDQTSVHPREIFRGAIRDNAKSIILVHNHPSGDPSPSDSDIKITRRMIDAGKLLDIPVDDHIIIGGDGWTSLRENNMCDF